MGLWMKIHAIILLALLCFAGQVLSGDSVTYDADDQPEWSDGEYGGSVIIMGAPGSDSDRSDSIAGNTVTIENIVVPTLDEPVGEGEYGDVYVFGGKNSEDSDPVTGNRVAVKDSKLGLPDDNPTDHIYSDIYGGFAGSEYNYMPVSPDYNGDYTANRNTVEIQDSTVQRITGGHANLLGDSLVDGGAYTTTTNANSNVVDVNNSAVSDVDGGSADIRYVTHPDSVLSATLNGHASANANQVAIRDGSTARWDIDGGAAYIDVSLFEEGSVINGTGIADANDNRVTVTGSTLEEGVWGGDAEVSVSSHNTMSGFTSIATAKNNQVEISDSTVKGEIIGGYSEVEGAVGAARATAESNRVTIKSGTVAIDDDIIVGGYAVSTGETRYSGEYDPETGTPINVIETYIPDNGGTAAAKNNSVTINGGTVTLKHVDNDDDGLEDVALVGGVAETRTGDASATDNYVTITGGNVKVGGYGIGGGAAISDSGNAKAVNNAVNISGGTVEGNVYGGLAASKSGAATATHNTVTVSGLADLSAASLFGGGTLPGSNSVGNDFFTGNTLNKNSAAIIKNAHNFEYVNFGYSGNSNITDLDTTGGTVKLNTGANTITLNGQINGTGSLAKTGSGALTLGHFDGRIDIGGKFTVGQGSLSLSKNAALKAGGGLVFAPGGEFTPNGNSLDVAGAVTFERGSFLNLAAIDKGKTILTSDIGIDGFFDSLFYETELRDGGKELSVIGTSTNADIVADLADSGVAIGQNGARGIGHIFIIVNMDSVNSGLKADLYAELEAIHNLANSGDGDAASIALAQLIGQNSLRSIEMTNTVAQSFAGAVFGHLSQMRDSRPASGGGGARSNGAFASLPVRSSYSRLYSRGYPSSDLANRVWAGGFGAFTRQDDRGGEYGYKYDAGGFILGYDRQFGNAVTAGVTGAYSRGRVKGSGGYGRTDIDTMNLGLYASYDQESGFYAEANLGFGHTWNKEREELVTGGSRQGKYRTYSFQMGGNIGYAFLLPAAFRVIPTFGVQFIRSHQKAYKQSGRAAMWRDANDSNYAEIPLAVRVNKTFELPNGADVTPELRAAWIGEARRDAPSVRAGYVGAPGSMILSGTNPGRSRGLVGAGVKARVNRTVDAFVDYNLEFRSKYRNHNIMAGVGMSF